MPVILPTIAILPPEDPRPLEEAARELGRYWLLILTSANAVEPLFEALERAGRDVRALGGLRLCAVGPGTAAAMAARGCALDLVAEDHRAEGLLALLPADEVRGQRVLLPRAAVGREVLPEVLRERGALVDVVTAYRTGLPAPEETRAGVAAIERGEVDVLTFTSPSTVQNLALLLGERMGALCRGRVVVAIGPVAAEACRRLGLAVDVMPRRFTVPAMVEALAEHLERVAVVSPISY